MANVNVVATEILPQAGANNKGWKLGFVQTKGKAAQNDTWTVTNATTVLFPLVTVDASGAAEAVTVSTNVVTLTSTTTGNCSGLFLFRK